MLNLESFCSNYLLFKLFFHLNSFFTSSVTYFSFLMIPSAKFIVQGLSTQYGTCCLSIWHIRYLLWTLCTPTELSRVPNCFSFVIHHVWPILSNFPIDKSSFPTRNCSFLPRFATLRSPLFAKLSFL